MRSTFFYVLESEEQNNGEQQTQDGKAQSNLGYNLNGLILSLKGEKWL